MCIMALLLPSAYWLDENGSEMYTSYEAHVQS